MSVLGKGEESTMIDWDDLTLTEDERNKWRSPVCDALTRNLSRCATREVEVACAIVEKMKYREAIPELVKLLHRNQPIVCATLIDLEAGEALEAIIRSGYWLLNPDTGCSDFSYEARDWDLKVMYREPAVRESLLARLAALAMTVPTDERERILLNCLKLNERDQIVANLQNPLDIWAPELTLELIRRLEYFVDEDRLSCL